MKIYKESIEFKSDTQIEFLDITDKVESIVKSSGIKDGQVLVYAPHTTMGIAVNHNEPMLIQDFMRILYKIIPVDDQYAHDLFELRRKQAADGRSNGHSHCKSLLVGTSETIPLDKGKLAIRASQSIFAIEFDGARKRDVIVQVMGE